jgi:hypothetical protein
MHLNHAMRKERKAMIYTQRISLAVVAVLVALIAVPGQASAGSLVPFRATFANTNTMAPCPPNAPAPSFCVALAGSGHATHMGKIQFSGLTVVNLASNCGPGCFTDSGPNTLTAANGDQITLDNTGKNSATSDPTIRTKTGTYVVTGGTGRFSGASGSGTASVIINTATSTSVGTLTGVLSTPGSRQ